MVLSKVTGAPGGVTTLQVSTATSGSNVVEVPILLPQGYYETLAPQGTPTTPSSSAEPPEPLRPGSSGLSRPRTCSRGRAR